MSERFCLGIDLGGTNTKYGLFDINGNLIAKDQAPTNLREEGKFIINDICNFSLKILRKTNVSCEQLVGMGIGVPGPVINSRIAKRCVNLGWGQVDVATAVENILGIKCKVANDADAAALGESWKGAAKDTHSAVMITIGTGIGGGIIMNDKIVEGYHGGAGEIGHFPVKSTKYTNVCTCGNNNCIETFASATGMMNTYNKIFNLKDEEITSKEIFEKASNNDSNAIKIINCFYDLLGRACAIISSTIDPEVFIIGGGLSNEGEILIKGIRKKYKKYAFQDMKDTKFALAKLKNDAGIYGAAKLALSEDE